MLGARYQKEQALVLLAGNALSIAQVVGALLSVDSLSHRGLYNMASVVWVSAAGLCGAFCSLATADSQTKGGELAFTIGRLVALTAIGSSTFWLCTALMEAVATASQ